MSAVKFTFDTVFAGTSDVASDAALARKRRTLTQAEIDALREEARREGSRANEVRALEAVAAGAEDAAIAVREAWKAAQAQIEGLRAEAAKLALCAARTLAGAALDAFGIATVEETLIAAMHQAIGEPRITLRASPGVAEAIKPRLDEIAHHEGFDGRIAIVADPLVANADCRIEWRGGGAERTIAAIDAALAGRMAHRFAQTKPIALIQE